MINISFSGEQTQRKEDDPKSGLREEEQLERVNAAPPELVNRLALQVIQQVLERGRIKAMGYREYSSPTDRR
jgi:hypothetical protein